MARTKVTKHQQLPKWLLRRGRGQRIKRTYPHKIKLTLPKKKKTSKYEKEWASDQNNVRQKSKYFSTRSARLF